jgi:hypothetical protein
VRVQDEIADVMFTAVHFVQTKIALLLDCFRCSTIENGLAFLRRTSPA